MNREEKAFLIASFVVIALLLFTVGMLYMIKESERDKRINLQRQLDSLTVEKQGLESKLKEMEIASAQAESTIKFQEEKIGMLSKSLDEEKGSNGKNLTKLQEREFEIKSLKTKIEEVKADKQAALKDLEKLYEHHLKLEVELENLTKTKEDLEKKAKEIAEKEGVSLGTVVIKQSR